MPNDTTHRLLFHLYDEADLDDETRARLRHDDDLAETWAALQATKAYLDDQPSETPRPSVVDRIVSTAKQEADKTAGGSLPEHGDGVPYSNHRGYTPDRPIPSDRDARPRSQHEPSEASPRVSRTAVHGGITALVLLIAIGLLLPVSGAFDTSEPTDAPIAGVQASDLPAWDEPSTMAELHGHAHAIQERMPASMSDVVPVGVHVHP